MALRLVAEFDLWEDVFPWLRVQRAASAGAETPGGGAGAGGAHLAGGGEGKRSGERVGAGEARSPSYLYQGGSLAGLRWWTPTRPRGGLGWGWGRLWSLPICEG